MFKRNTFAFTSLIVVALSGCSEYKVNGQDDGIRTNDTDLTPVTGDPTTGLPTGFIWTETTGTASGTGSTTGSGPGTGGTTTGSGPGTGGTTTGSGPGTGGTTTGSGPGTGGSTGTTTGTGPGTGGSTGTGSGATTGTGTGTWGVPATADTSNWGECDWASHVAGFLDPLQTPNDGKVLFCHSSGGSTYVYNNTSINSCLTHIGHAYDIFPNTICDS